VDIVGREEIKEVKSLKIKGARNGALNRPDYAPGRPPNRPVEEAGRPPG